MHARGSATGMYGSSGKTDRVVLSSRAVFGNWAVQCSGTLCGAVQCNNVACCVLRRECSAVHRCSAALSCVGSLCCGVMCCVVLCCAVLCWAVALLYEANRAVVWSLYALIWACTPLYAQAYVPPFTDIYLGLYSGEGVCQFSSIIPVCTTRVYRGRTRLVYRT